MSWWKLKAKAQIFLLDYEQVPADCLLGVLTVIYRYKDNGLAFKLRLLANSYDTRPREWP